MSPMLVMVLPVTRMAASDGPEPWAGAASAVPALEMNIPKGRSPAAAPAGGSSLRRPARGAPRCDSPANRPGGWSVDLVRLVQHLREPVGPQLVDAGTLGGVRVPV